MNAATLAPVSEIHRLRTERDQLRDMLAALVDAIDHETDHELRRQLAAEAYQRGQDDAYSAGYVAAVADMKRTQHELVDAFRLTGLRYSPRGAVWLAAVERNCGTEFGGLGMPRVPVPPEVVKAAKGGQR